MQELYTILHTCKIEKDSNNQLTNTEKISCILNICLSQGTNGIEILKEIAVTPLGKMLSKKIAAHTPLSSPSL